MKNFTAPPPQSVKLFTNNKISIFLAKLDWIEPGIHDRNVGDWKQLKECPRDEHVIGVRLRISISADIGDKTALNAIELECNGGQILKNGETKFASLPNRWGQWTRIQSEEYFMGVQIRQEKYQGWSGDDTAANGLRFITNSQEIKKPGDGKWGDWSDMVKCVPGMKIVGFKSRVHPYKDSLFYDNNGITQVHFLCK